MVFSRKMKISCLMVPIMRMELQEVHRNYQSLDADLLQIKEFLFVPAAQQTLFVATSILPSKNITIGRSFQKVMSLFLFHCQEEENNPNTNYQ